MRTINEDLEEVSGGRKRKDWFEDGRCTELSNMAGWSASICERNEVNSANSVKGTKPN